MKSLNDSNNRGYVGLKLAVAEIARRIDIAPPDLKEPVKMIIAGGVAVNFYCGSRATTDVGASFSRRIALPEDLVVPYETPDGKLLTVHLDTNYNTTFGLDRVRGNLREALKIIAETQRELRT